MNDHPFAEAVRNGGFVIAAECRPPRGSDSAPLTACAAAIGSRVHGISVPESDDGVRLSSLASCAHLSAAGADPILHLLTRDQNRIALQSSILGAASMGVNSILCLSGRHQALTASNAARGVYDVDPVQLLRIADLLRREGKLEDGQIAGSPMDLILGTDTNPFANPMDLHVLALDAAVSAGADFVITQPIFNLDRFNVWMSYVRERKIHDRTCIIAGVMPITSSQEAVRLAEKYNTIDIRDEDVERLSAVPDQRSAGVHLAAETIAYVSRIEGVRGVYLMTGEDHTLADELIRESKISRS